MLIILRSGCIRPILWVIHIYNQIEHSIWDESSLFCNCACSLEYSNLSTLAGLSYHICGKLEVAFKASPSSQQQHCTSKAQEAYLTRFGVGEFCLWSLWYLGFFQDHLLLTLHHPCGSRLEDRIVVRPFFAFSVTLSGTSCWTSVLTQGKPCFAVISIPFYYSFLFLFFATFGFRLSTLLWGLSGPLGSVFWYYFLCFFINCEFGGLISLKIAFV